MVGVKALMVHSNQGNCRDWLYGFWVKMEMDFNPFMRLVLFVRVKSFYFKTTKAMATNGWIIEGNELVFTYVGDKMLFFGATKLYNLGSLQSWVIS